MSLLPATSHLSPSTPFWEANFVNPILSVPITAVTPSSFTVGQYKPVSNTPSLPSSLAATDIILHTVNITADVTGTSPTGNLTFWLFTGTTNAISNVSITQNSQNVKLTLMAMGSVGASPTCYVAVGNNTNASLTLANFTIQNSGVVKIGSSV